MIFDIIGMSFILRLQTSQSQCAVALVCSRRMKHRLDNIV